VRSMLGGCLWMWMHVEIFRAFTAGSGCVGFCFISVKGYVVNFAFLGGLVYLNLVAALLKEFGGIGFRFQARRRPKLHQESITSTGVNSFC
jgi:hypothetical protein